ncbi:hypothetical protein HPB48_022675 [Haemaphysalis longicornis]|uniref:Gag-like protein n=1 Tax=Haemaphysalis longicornis TaxID=44386 RepID=A0A9J6FW61_HAELO|nr:hypothetical protein HPB48_022675 [Haemaphysalis longicornis]
MPPADNAGGQPPGRPPPGAKMPSSFQPTKDLVFNVTVPADASTVSVIDAVADVVGLPNVYMVQHLGGARFQCTLYTSAAMEQLLRHGGLSVCGKEVAIEVLAPRLTRVVCLSLPGYVVDEHLIRALAPYGKVVSIERPTTVDRPSVRSGHRVVHIEMKPEKPVPNFIRVLEHRVICDYPGILRVCSRCKKAGHYRKDWQGRLLRPVLDFRAHYGKLHGKMTRTVGAKRRHGGGQRKPGTAPLQTPPSSTTPAEESAAPSQSETSRDDSEVRELPPSSATDTLQTPATEMDVRTNEDSSAAPRSPLVIDDDEFSDGNGTRGRAAPRL